MLVDGQDRDQNKACVDSITEQVSRHMHIPKEAIVWVSDETNLPEMSEMTPDQYLQGKANYNTCSGCSIVLTNNLWLGIAKPLADLKEELKSGWCTLNEDDVHIILANEDGSREFRTWHDFWLNLPSPQDQHTLGLPMLPRFISFETPRKAAP